LFIKQSTLQKIVYISGFGLHTGRKVNLKLKPAGEDFGIVFKRIDLSCCIEIPAMLSYVSKTSFSTVLMKNGVYIKTVEHLLSALFAFGVDNVLIEIDAEEIPIMDGSAYPFIYMLQLCGLKFLNSPKKFLRIRKLIRVRSGDKYVVLKPRARLSVSISLYFDCHSFCKKSDLFNFEFSKSSYFDLISKARTFGFYHQYEYLLSRGLAKGVNLNNVLVFIGGDYLNRNILRYHDEIFRHKVLDILGDISLLGKNIVGSFYGCMSGHTLNIKLLNALVLNTELYDVVLLHRKYGFVFFNNV